MHKIKRSKFTNTTEKQIEQKLVKAIKAVGGIAPKFISPCYDGMPDRIVLLPGGRIAFVEVKLRDASPDPCRRPGMRCCGS